MSIPQKQLHAFAVICVALSHADGDVDPRELGALALALRDLGMSRSASEKAVERAVHAVSGEADRLDRMLAAACKRIPARLRPAVFETAAHVVLADGHLGDAECLRLAALRGMLALPEPVAFAVVASAASGHPRLSCALSRSLA